MKMHNVVRDGMCVTSVIEVNVAKNLGAKREVLCLHDERYKINFFINVFDVILIHIESGFLVSNVPF